MGNIYEDIIYNMLQYLSQSSQNICRKNPRDNPTPAGLHKKDGAQRLRGESQSNPFFVDLLREIILLGNCPFASFSFSTVELSSNLS